MVATQLSSSSVELPAAGTHLHTFWAVVPRGADVSGESLGGGRGQGSPMGTVKRSAKSIGAGGDDLGFHPTLRGRDQGQRSSLPRF